jgi:beta-lactamase superfamily II metal-dependent hydrolase
MRRISCLAGLLITSFCGVALAGDVPASQPAVATFTCWQLPNQTKSQIMSYVIRTPGGRLVVIDGGVKGDAGYLKGFLAALGNRVDAWFITHLHDDHYGALIEILKAHGDLRIGTLYGSLPDVEWTRQYGEKYDVPTGAEFYEAVRSAGKNIDELKAGQELRFDGVRFEVLAVKNPEIHLNAINNSSLVLRVSNGGKSILFLADLGEEGGRKLLASPLGRRVHADYVQMAHHGQNGVDEAFYRAVGAKYCLWPTPDWLWDNNKGSGMGSGPWKTLEVRAWMGKLNIAHHYVMQDGLQRID